MHQIEMVSLNSLVQESHVYRNFNKIWSFKNTEMKLRKFEKNNPHKGYGLLRLFKCLLLQCFYRIPSASMHESIIRIC